MPAPGISPGAFFRFKTELQRGSSSGFSAGATEARGLGASSSRDHVFTWNGTHVEELAYTVRRASLHCDLASLREIPCGAEACLFSSAAGFDF